MQLLSTLKSALMASAITVGSVSCDSRQKQHQKEVDHILSVIQPTEDLIQEAGSYYGTRDDLGSLTPDQFKSLKDRQPYLMMTGHALEKGELSHSEFLQILQSPKPMITDRNTRLKISTTPAVDIKRVSVVGNEIEISTGKETADIIRSPEREVVLQGGTMTVIFTGEGFKCLYKGRDKGQILARDKVKFTSSGKQSITITVSLVTSKK